MPLVGPFPCAMVITDSQEGYRLLAAVAHFKRLYFKNTPEYKVYDELYKRVLMACGDD